MSRLRPPTRPTALTVPARSAERDRRGDRDGCGAAGKAIAAALATALLVGGCAGVDPLGPQPVWGAAQSAVKGRGNVFVSVDDEGVATVRGWVEDRLSKNAVLDAVVSHPETTGLIDYLRVDRGVF